MSVVVVCPRCGRQYRLSDTALGKRACCRSCQGTFAVEPAGPALSALASAEPTAIHAPVRPASRRQRPPWLMWAALGTGLAVALTSAGVLLTRPGPPTVRNVHPAAVLPADANAPDATPPVAVLTGPAAQLGPFAVTLPGGFVVVHGDIPPDDAKPSPGDQAMAWAGGTGTWAGTTPAGRPCTVEVRVDVRIDHAHDVPVPGDLRVNHFGPDADQRRAETLAATPHDEVTVNGIRYLRTLTPAGQPWTYSAYSGMNTLQLSIADDDPADATAATLLRSVVDDLRRTVTESQQQSIVDHLTATPDTPVGSRPTIPLPTRWQLAGEATTIFDRFTLSLPVGAVPVPTGIPRLLKWDVSRPVGEPVPLAVQLRPQAGHRWSAAICRARDHSRP